MDHEYKFDDDDGGGGGGGGGGGEAMQIGDGRGAVDDAFAAEFADMLRGHSFGQRRVDTR